MSARDWTKTQRAERRYRKLTCRRRRLSGARRFATRGGRS